MHRFPWPRCFIVMTDMRFIYSCPKRFASFLRMTTGLWSVVTCCWSPVCLSFCSTGRLQYLQPRRHQHQGILHVEKGPGLCPFRRLLLSVRFFPVESPASGWNADCPLLRLCPITGSDSSRAFLRLRTRLSGRSPSDNHSSFHRANRWFFLSSRVTPDPASHDHSYLPIHRWSFIGKSSSGGYCEAGTSESGVSDPDFQILYRYAHSAIHHWKTAYPGEEASSYG